MSGYSLNSYHRGSGIIIENIQGAQTVPAYSLVYVDANGQWTLADADTVATMPVVGLATEPLLAGQYGRVVALGLAGLRTWTWTAGDLIYASTTAGVLTQTAPTGTGDQRQAVAVAVTATVIYFNPSLASLDSIGMADYETGVEPIHEPTTAAKGDGHIVVQYYTDGQNRTFQWNRSNGAWTGVELL